jgi:hypothetical protein
MPTAEPIHYRIVLDSAGDPQTLAVVLPRCPADGRIARGDVVQVGEEVWHEGCWGQRARDRVREPEP